jgi:hypothetical protein
MAFSAVVARVFSICAHTVVYNRWLEEMREGCSQGAPDGLSYSKQVDDRSASARQLWVGVSLGVSWVCGLQEMARPDAVLTHDSIHS